MTCPRHADFDNDCFACKVRSVSFSAHATPTRKPEVTSIDHREGRWGPDMDAYYRLRKNGLQPRGIDGAAHLERHASDQMEIEYGRTLTPAQIKEAKAGMEAAAEIREEAS